MKFYNIVGIVLIIAVASFIFAISAGNGNSPKENPASNEVVESSQPLYTPSFNGAEKIPDYVYENTMGNDTFYEIIDTNKTMKHIFWAYADCPTGNNLKSDIDSVLEMNGLTSSYIHDGNLMSGGLMVTCNNHTMKCVEPYLYDNCSDNICIIKPDKKEILKIPNDNLPRIEKTLIRAKNW